MIALAKINALSISIPRHLLCGGDALIFFDFRGDVYKRQGISAPPAVAHTEQAAGIFGIGGIEQAEHLINRHAQIAAHLADQIAVLAGAQLVVQDVQAVGDQLFVHGGQGAAAIDAVPRRIRVGNILHPQGQAVAVRAAAQQIIACLLYTSRCV